MTSWWNGIALHKDIRDGQVNEALFAANLGKAVEGEGPSEYCEAQVFWKNTFLGHQLRELLTDILRTVAGQRGQNPVTSLQTNFGGGKTHAELAIYHLLKRPEQSMRVPEVRQLVFEAGMDSPPRCQIAVLPGAALNPLGRTTADGVRIQTLWGEMAYRLAGKQGYGLVAANDAQLVSPGEDTLQQVLEMAGPCVILLDETLHYVDRASRIEGSEGDLAKQTVAFLRELTEAVGTVPGCMLVVSLTAGRMDQLSDRALEWLDRMDKHVTRVAKTRAPIEGAEIFGIVRQRLFESVDEQAARQVAAAYHRLYMGLGVPGQVKGAAYRELIERSYPFHPELVTILYERWGSKPSFQLTRGTLTFLALVLQDLWQTRSDADPDLIQPSDISLGESTIRAFVRDVAGEPQWEAVLGSDVAAAPGAQLAKAQLIDQERDDGRRIAEALAGTIMLYSQSGGESPFAARHELRLACARPGLDEALWDDALGSFSTRLFYFYSDEGKYRFRIEPNVVSLHHTYRTNLQPSEVGDYLSKTIEGRALGISSVTHGFATVLLQPESAEVDDDGELSLVVLDLDHTADGKELPDETREAISGILERRGQVLRQHRNRLVFCVADGAATQTAAALASDYLSWRKVERNKEDWDRIGGAQQALVKDQLNETAGGALKAMISAYTLAVVPAVDSASGQLSLRPIRLGAYGPGKLVAPMVWERLTGENGGGKRILTTLTPDTLLQRYGPQAWPESEVWITTAQLWDRFSRQVALPILARHDVLLATLDLGQREKLFAIGHLADVKSPRDQRDSYLSLYFDTVLPANVPGIGERWLLLRPAMYRQIVEAPVKVTAQEVAQAIEELDGGGQSVRVQAVYNYVKARNSDSIDDASFRSALASLLKETGGNFAYRVDEQSPVTAEAPQDLGELLAGTIVMGQAKGHGVPAAGRTVAVEGRLLSLSELAPLYKKVLSALHSQSPDEFTIRLQVSARFDSDPGAGLDAILEDGFKQEDFPGLTLRDSKKT